MIDQGHVNPYEVLSNRSHARAQDWAVLPARAGRPTTRARPTTGRQRRAMLAYPRGCLSNKR